MTDPPTRTDTERLLLHELLEALRRGRKGALTQSEAAEYLSISRARVSELTTRGEIPVVYHGRKPTYRLEGLNRFLAQREQGGDEWQDDAGTTRGVGTSIGRRSDGAAR